MFPPHQRDKAYPESDGVPNHGHRFRLCGLQQSAQLVADGHEPAQFREGKPVQRPQRDVSRRRPARSRRAPPGRVGTPSSGAPEWVRSTRTRPRAAATAARTRPGRAAHCRAPARRTADSGVLGSCGRSHAGEPTVQVACVFPPLCHIAAQALPVLSCPRRNTPCPAASSAIPTESAGYPKRRTSTRAAVLDVTTGPTDSGSRQ